MTGSHIDWSDWQPIELRGRPQHLYCLTFGWEAMEESGSIRGGSADRFLLEPITGAAVAYENGWVLIDTGPNPELVRDPVRRAKYYAHAHLPSLAPGDPMIHQIEATGLGWPRLAMCALSHLHCDHSGGLRHLANGPPVALQRREHEFAFREASLADAYFDADFGVEGIAWNLIDGGKPLAPGLSAFPTYGHTPGHQSFAIQLAGQGTVVLACDAADLQRNVEEQCPPGGIARNGDQHQAELSIGLLHDLHRQPDTEVWPGHDPKFWETRRSPPEAYS